ncbi:MAG TPA: hypothetical protein PLI41_05065 [Bacteroidales bacterium]|nr:hypothetical protein [Bacteroidales bacterium]HQB36900.1 hypothetical protein [Bacteroidales bacterium]
MNKIFRIGSGILVVMSLFIMLCSGCRGGKKAEQEVIRVDMEDKTAILEDIEKAERVFQALPSPLESAMLIKSSGAGFDQKLLNPVSNANNYVTSKSMALNLGIYTCDLSYASLYEQTQLLIDYMEAAKKMADGLGILRAIEQKNIDELEQNINNSEVIMKIVSETFLNSNSYLEENDQPATASMVLLGGWIEGLYLSTKLVNMNNFDGNKLVSRIIDQKLSIDILLNLLSGSKGNPAIDELISEVTKLKIVFDKIRLDTSPVRPVYDEASEATILRSEVKTDMTPEVFSELAALASEIRNSFVK